MSVSVRPAKAGDEQDWRILWGQYCNFYGVSLTREVNDSLWERVMDPASTVNAIVAVWGDKGHKALTAGFANYVLHPYTWGTEQVCYLEDLFVTEAARGQGVGRALIGDLIERAKVNRWPRLYWHTHESNAAARLLYESIVPVDPFVRYLVRVRPSD